MIWSALQWAKESRSVVMVCLLELGMAAVPFGWEWDCSKEVVMSVLEK